MEQPEAGSAGTKGLIAFVALGVGGYHWFCDATGVVRTPDSHKLLAFGPACVGAVAGGLEGLIGGTSMGAAVARDMRRYGDSPFLPTEADGAVGGALGGTIGGTLGAGIGTGLTTLFGYGVGYGVGYMMR